MDISCSFNYESLQLGITEVIFFENIYWAHILLFGVDEDINVIMVLIKETHVKKIVGG